MKAEQRTGFDFSDVYELTCGIAGGILVAASLIGLCFLIPVY